MSGRLCGPVCFVIEWVQFFREFETDRDRETTPMKQLFLLFCCAMLLFGSGVDPRADERASTPDPTASPVGEAGPSAMPERSLAADVAPPTPSSGVLPEGKEDAVLPSDPVLQAMQQELLRSKAQLRLPGYEAPYFISYRLTDTTETKIQGKYGAVITSDTNRRRYLTVEVRVGDYHFDNTMIQKNYEDFFSQYYMPNWVLAPIEDNTDAFRHLLWQLTDTQYKVALNQFLKKKAKNVYEAEETEDLDDFTREEAHFFIEPPRTFSFDRAKWEAITRRVTDAFRMHPDIFDLEMNVNAQRERVSFLNTEGSIIETEEHLISLSYGAKTRAPDGMVLPIFKQFYYRKEADMPSEARLLADVLRMIEDLLALGSAEELSPVNVPAILSPEAAGVLFHEAVGHRLEGERQRIEEEGQTFTDRVGERILPDFLSVIDDPTLERFEGVDLNGYYRYDYDGIPAQRVVLVDHGILENFLMSRTPIKGFSHSNGHGRSSYNHRPVGRQGNLIVRSHKELPYAVLKARLLETVRAQKKPFGLIVKDIRGGETNTRSGGYQAFKGTPTMVYKVDPETGKETLVRGLEIVGTPLTTLNNIIATSDDYRVFNGFCGAESGYVSVSTIAPSILVKELEFQRTSDRKERPPILLPPAFDTTIQPEKSAEAP
ncbi:MAG: TldD/PmbA family protein [Deltaproteobacteria bacterium]|nr:MAG: TldD/PmbA family protein [Deltaproteobacteria bacterium]